MIEVKDIPGVGSEIKLEGDALRILKELSVINMHVLKTLSQAGVGSYGDMIKTLFDLLTKKESREELDHILSVQEDEWHDFLKVLAQQEAEHD